MIAPAVERRWTNRLRMMVRHTWLIVIAVVLMSAGFSAVAFYFFNLPTHLKIAVGPPNSEDVRVVQAIRDEWPRDGGKAP